MKGDPLETFEKLRKKVSLSRRKLLEAFENIYIFLKSIRLKSHSAEKRKKEVI